MGTARRAASWQAVATLRTYDDTFASFTATSLSSYAMVAVPEPGTLALLTAGLVGLLTCIRRKRKGR